MKLKLTWLLTLFMAFVMQFSFAQEKTVTGTVTTKDDGLPLPGANVIVKGTSRGQQTDFDGKYTIQVSQGDVLTVSYVGMKTTEITIGAANTYNVALELDNTLDEVVVQAFRTATKETSSVASVTVTSSTIEARPNANFVQTLQGQVAGLNIITASGQPGGNSTVNLRGVGSVNGNTEPLFIIDGVPVDEDNFRSLNPNDIETLSVLKDAGATSIYGNRGANGVVVITTKRASFNTGLQVKYVGTSSISRLQTNDYDLMNSREELQLQKDYGAGFGSTLSDQELALRASMVNTDWLDVFFGTAYAQTHTLSLSAGGENINSFTSFGFTDQEGILNQASGLKRFNFRNNISGKSEDKKFEYNTSLSLNYSRNNVPLSIGTGGVNRNLALGAVSGVPYISPNDYDPDNAGNIPVSFQNTPLLLLDLLEHQTYREDEIKILASANASYKITDNLTYKFTIGADFTDEKVLYTEHPDSFKAQYFAEDGNETPGRQDQDSNMSVLINVTNALTYRKMFDKHTLEASVFTEYFKAHWRSFGYVAEGLDFHTFSPGDGAGFVDDNSANDYFIDTADATVRNAGLFSYFGFVDYDYDTKYGVSATLRRDASYRFAASNRWGTFWSVSGRWNIHNEPFMEGSVFDMLKLRASYGTAGNQDIVSAAGQFAPFNAPDLTRDLFATGGQYGGANGYSVGQIGNNDLKWETVAQANIGLDFGVFQNRLRGSVDVYKKNTTDLYLPTPISPALNGGISSISANVGELENRGVDLELHYDLLRSNDTDGLNLTLNLVGNYNKQEFIDLGGAGDVAFTRRVGGPLSEIYAAPFAGVNPANGNLLFYDIDGNLTEDIDEGDQRATGKNLYPDYQGSFGFNVSYKNFYLDTQFNYTIGVYRYDFDYSDYLDPTSIGQFRHTRDILDAWQQPGDITNIPSLTATNIPDDQFSDRFLRDSDYIRLRFLQFGYNVPKKFTDDIGFSFMRIFGSAENLVTWTKWRGFDAEGVGSTQWEYPTPRTYSIGVEFGF
ncbi:SusC/RagA family TonB-linked outer membrane protein [Winogradskyella sp. SYSU M77433]|uniref:SusC/RagA family TonB-linked outer membrane protein n=1 Tax=Winogradskyella sp. SYSU M77433 TaxID=3042722 RepID=UPI00247FCC5D|nr:SusC/RagA family TonB-linked outer membrane protein [Winogradskyella sp. SYSU M77433]MDH7911763.1 SusC/RagA family TonB-linked outer membrane protein [Winogradskyella sp. SYSU M77433]